MSDSANIRELYTALSRKKQTNISTRVSDADLVWMTRTNSAPANVMYNAETDALDYGKGAEWARKVYNAGVDATVDIEKYLSSEIGAYLAVFGMGKSSVATAAPGIYSYVGHPLVPTVNIELPYMTYVEGMRVDDVGGTSFFDRALVGCAVNNWSLNYTAGPGRQAATVTMQLVGSGKVLMPSTVQFGGSPTLPEAPVRLSGVFIGPAIPANDLASQQRVISLTLSYNNNIRLEQGYYAGQVRTQSHADRGRLEIGDRTIEISLVMRAVKGSPEYYALVNGTENSFTFWSAGAYLQPEGPDYYPNTVNFTAAMARITGWVIGEEEGIATVQCAITPIQVNNDDVCTLAVVTALQGVGS